jgi:hypothetical protein
MSVVVALGNDISRRSGAVSTSIVDSWKVNFSYKWLAALGFNKI